jgi:hypothetical protein
MKNTILLLIAIISLNGNIFAADLSKEMLAQNRQVVKMAVKALSEKLPQTVDKYTQFTAISNKGLTLIYTFEINTGAKSDEAVIREDKKRMEKHVKSGICTSSKRFLDSQINISYIYLSAKTKKELFKFDVTKSDCKESIFK